MYCLQRTYPPQAEIYTKIDSHIFFSVSTAIKCLCPNLICPFGSLNPELAHRWALGVPAAQWMITL